MSPRMMGCPQVQEGADVMPALVLLGISTGPL